MTLKIVGAGFGRTGTLSMKAALEQIGFGPCYHMSEVISHPPFAEHWMTATAGGKVDWNEVFEGYVSAVDWPSCAFYGDHASLYPDSKVILTVRDLNTWYESCQATIFNVMRPPLELVPPHMKHVAKLARTLVAEKTFSGRIDDRAHCIAVHQAHIDEVKQTIPPSRLLVFDVKQGWDPLCRFLGVPVPATAFPRVNEREEFGKDLPRGASA